MQNSSTHIAFKDGTSSEASQPVIETTAPSNSLASVMANWVVVVAPTRDAVPPQPKDPSADQRAAI